MTSNAENGSAVSSAETMSESSAGDTEQLCEICTQEGAYACDTCLMAVCLRCGYTGRHDNTAIRSYASTRRREVACALQHAIETRTSYADNPMEEAFVDDNG